MDSGILGELTASVERGDRADAAALTRRALEAGVPAVVVDAVTAVGLAHQLVGL